jgi:dinuclear metal center YbgI/SA1388 family protein
MHREELVGYLEEYLRVGDVRDYGPQGLQVEGRPEVRKIVTSVSASVELFERAVAAGADAILVHHGILWDREPRVVRGPMKRRLRLLLEHDLNLMGYHICLDRHEEVGNNVLAARGLGLREIASFGLYNGASIGFQGDAGGVPAEEMVRRINEFYGSRSLTFLYGPAAVRRAGIISGGAPREMQQAIDHGLDMFVTGEASEFVMHKAQEAGLHYVAAGHYATERIGIRTLGEHLAARFGLEAEFIDIPNPV